MNRETIEKAAKKHANAYCPDENPAGYSLGKKTGYIRGFKNGANWCIDSLWHDKDENPKFKGKVEKEGLLLLYSFGQCVLLYLDKDEWEHLLSYATFVKWAYIDNLLPDGKEDR